MNTCDIRTLARTLFLAGVRAADPALAVKQALDTRPMARAPEGRLIIIAVGKAACAMMAQALQQVPEGQALVAVAVTNYENACDIPGSTVFASGHPLPDRNGVDAGIEIMDLLAGATDRDKVLCLISGGGSALLPTPRKGLTLADKIMVNETLLAGGVDIIQMNAVRQQLSVLKGGGLLEMAHPAKVRSLIISDVVGDDVSTIASGPTAYVTPDLAQMIAHLKARDLWSKFPQHVQTLLAKPKRMTQHPADNTIVCFNRQSLQAIRDAAPDWAPKIVSDHLTGDVREAAKAIVDHARSQKLQEKQLLIWGGETTVNLTGGGKGGRNQELALHVALLARDLPGEWVFLSGGTDGRDGPTDAAGGIVKPTTIARAQDAGIDVAAALRNNDSYRILEKAGGLLITGPTGTNVADIQMLFRLS